MLKTIPKITVRKDDALALSQFLNAAGEFNTHGNLRGRREFQGFGEYEPFDEAERDELRMAVYVVYSYDTPIAWLTRSGTWVRNATQYSATTAGHQAKVFMAISLL